MTAPLPQLAAASALAAALFATACDDPASRPPLKARAWNVQHDGHLFISAPYNLAHHPDCPLCKDRHDR